MGLRLSDTEIQALLDEPKPLPADWRSRLKLKPKRGHKERELEIEGEKGSKFRLVLRQADANPLDFSIILGLNVPTTNQFFRLVRCNGKSQEHTNNIEGETFYDFHVHRATERYQDEGHPEDRFAQVTDKYCDFHGALETIITEGGFVRPNSSQMTLPGVE